MLVVATQCSHLIVVTDLVLPSLFGILAKESSVGIAQDVLSKFRCAEVWVVHCSALHLFRVLADGTPRCLDALNVLVIAIPRVGAWSVKTEPRGPLAFGLATGSGASWRSGNKGSQGGCCGQQAWRGLFSGPGGGYC